MKDMTAKHPSDPIVKPSPFREFSPCLRAMHGVKRLGPKHYREVYDHFQILSELKRRRESWEKGNPGKKTEGYFQWLSDFGRAEIRKYLQGICRAP